MENKNTNRGLHHNPLVTMESRIDQPNDTPYSDRVTRDTKLEAPSVEKHAQSERVRSKNLCPEMLLQEPIADAH